MTKKNFEFIRIMAHKPYTAGALISSSQPFVHVLEDGKKNMLCDYCFFECNALKQCGACRKMFYCNTQCQKSDWKKHKLECPIFAVNYGRLHGTNIRFVLRLFLFLRAHPKEWDTAIRLQTDPSRTRTMRDLLSHRADIEGSPKREEFTSICNIFNLLGIKYERDELLDLYGKIEINGFTAENPLQDAVDVKMGFGLYLAESIFDHSCWPNAATVFIGNRIEVRALKTIEENEPIYITYIDLMQKKPIRQRQLKEQYFFDCECTKCQSDYDSAYIYPEIGHAEKQIEKCFVGDDNERALKLHEFQLEWLNKHIEVYGEHYPLNTHLLVAMVANLIGIDKKFARTRRNNFDREYRKVFQRCKKNIGITHGPNSELFNVFLHK